MNPAVIKPALTLCAVLCAALLTGQPSVAEERAGAAAAALQNQATALEGRIDKDCQKVAREARPLCRQQHQQAVQRLRARATRAR